MDSGGKKRMRYGLRIRRFAVGVNTLIAMGLVLVIFLMVNYLSFRHYLRADWSRAAMYTLSDKTMNLLAMLTNQVDVVVFFQSNQDVYENVSNLLKEYEYASKQIRVEWVDPDRDVARTEELMRKYGVKQANVVVFDADGRTKYVTGADLIQYDMAPVQRGQMPVVAAFKGEQAFSSAIQNITQMQRPMVYFLEGHGERDIDDFSKSGGYSSIAQAMRRDNIDVKKLKLGEARVIPEDCDVLIVAGADKQLSIPEIDAIRNYVENKGSLLVLTDALTETGIDAVLDEWGIRISNDVVVDATRTMTGRELFVTQYDPHPITANLKNETSIFYLPRSVLPASADSASVDRADRPRVMPLASCSEAGWGESDLTQSPMKYDVETDRPGPVPIAVAAEKGQAPGIDLQIHPTRMVVFGDSDFVANSVLTSGNSDFFLSALNWLLEREALMAIAPKSVERGRLIITRTQLRGLFWVIVGGLPGLIALFGGIVWLRRRS